MAILTIYKTTMAITITIAILMAIIILINLTLTVPPIFICKHPITYQTIKKSLPMSLIQLIINKLKHTHSNFKVQSTAKAKLKKISIGTPTKECKKLLQIKENTNPEKKTMISKKTFKNKKTIQAGLQIKNNLTTIKKVINKEKYK